MQYSDFQNMPSSEKITLAILSASKRLMGWEVHAGSVYKIAGVTFKVINSIEDSGTAYTAAAGVGSVTAGKYYLDTSTDTLYIQTTGSVNPNSLFIVANINLFFANVPIAMPNDLSTGADVFFEPLVKSTSEFGVDIDVIAQTSEVIEGSGSLVLNNDFDFWPSNYDKLTFENQRCTLYSYHRDMAPTEATLLFKGRVEKQSYSKDTITFSLKDQFAELRAPLPLIDISVLAERTGTDLATAKQRTIFGRVYGNVPTNIDQVVDGYPITGNVAVASNSLTVTGTGTAFLAELSPDDALVLNGEEYNIATVDSNTSLTLADAYDGNTSLSGATAYVIPEQPKRWMNRRFLVAGHALREALTTVQAGGTIDTLYVVSTRDFYDGDTIYIGTLGAGELAVVQNVIGENYLRLATSLASVPANGTPILRPAVQNVRMNTVPLDYYADYTFDATTAVLTLRDECESNAAPILQLPASIAITNASRTVTGSGFNKVIEPGYMIGVVGNAIFFEVLSVESDTSLTLRTAASFSATTTGRYKSLIYSPGDTVLSLDCVGRTDDGTTSGVLLRTAPAITKALLQDAGLTAELNVASFTEAEGLAYQHIGMVIPDQFNDKTSPSYRDVINKVNKSVFGALVQNGEFKFTYEVLRPKKSTATVRFLESDIIAFTQNATAENIVKTVIVEYQPKEYDYVTGKSAISTHQKTSDTATYLIKTDRTKTVSTWLATSTGATTMASRWGFLLQNNSGRLTFTTKLQGATLEVGDVIEVEHRKFFDRHGSSNKRRLLLVESIKKNGSDVKIEATDLSNTFNRVANINAYTSTWTTATEDELLYGGFITDQYGLVNNNPISFATNLIW